jgi:orotate phosphoribosyltransferase
MLSTPDLVRPREQRLRELGQDIAHAAYLRGRFVLRSGATSNYYFDKYLFETKPNLLRRVASFLAELVPPGTDRLAGPELGGVALATAVSLDLGLPFVIVRKAQKAYATSAQIEGELYAGERVALLEDVVTTGTAVIQAARALRAAGAIVQDAIVVIDREEGGAEALAAEGLQFWPLFRRSQLGL